MNSIFGIVFNLLEINALESVHLRISLLNRLRNHRFDFLTPYWEKVFILFQLEKMRVFARSYPLFRRDKKFGDNIDYIFQEAKCRIRRMSIERELQDIRFNLRINFIQLFLRNFKKCVIEPLNGPLSDEMIIVIK